MSDWIEWYSETSLEMPVKAGTRVKIRTLVDQYITDKPEKEDWRSGDDIDRVLAYKLVRDAEDVAAEALANLEAARDEIYHTLTMMMKKGHSTHLLQQAHGRVCEAISDLSILRK